jgi:hypothetical protein
MSNFITTPESTIKAITQTAHGFTVGQWVYISGASTYALADADATSTLDSVGVVTTVTDANTFSITTEGYAIGLSGLTAGTRYYISGTAGAITSTAPTNAKAVFIADTATSGYVQQYGASATGTITPLANFSLSAISTASITGTIRNLTTPLAANASVVLPTTTRLGLTSAVLTLNTPAIVTNSSNITVGSDALTFTQAGRYQAVASVNPLGIGVNHAFFIQAVKNGTTVVGFGVGQPGGGNSTDQATVEINTDFAIGDTLDFRIASNQSTGITQGATSITVNQLPTSVSVPVDVVPEYGETVIAPLTSTTGSATFVDVPGSSFTLPSAGTWEVFYYLPVFNSGANRCEAQIYTSGDVVVVDTGSVANGNSGAANVNIPLVNTARIITTSATTYKLKWATSGGTMQMSTSSTGDLAPKITWKKISGFLPSSGQTVSYLRARMNPSTATNVTNTTSINGYVGERMLWNETTASSGDKITYNSTTGGFTVKAGTPVSVRANVNKVYNGGFYSMGIADVTTGTPVFLTNSNASNLGTGGDGIVLGHRREHMDVIIPAQGTDRIYVLEHIGGWNALNSYWNNTAFGGVATAAQLQDWTNIEITQLGTSAAVTTTATNDQSATGYFDIGNMRMQWGTHNDGNVDTTTVTLPAAFANTNYSVVATSNTSAGSLDTESKTTTAFDIDRASTTTTVQDYSWIAIGIKP